jgi:uncharacterized repeat protein (TIGR03803 family)
MGKLPLILTLLVIMPVMTRDSLAQTETLLYTFTGGSDGGVPYAGLATDKAGNLYGTTELGGHQSCGNPFGQCGVVFELIPVPDSPAPTWSERVLYMFNGGNDGAGPESGLISDGVAALYGTTEAGGGSGCVLSGCGTVFALQKKSSTDWTENILYSFTGGADGANPVGPLVWGKDGSLYGTTAYGGNPVCNQLGPGCGTVFQLKPSGTGWSETVIYAFDGMDGTYPNAGVTLDSAGNIYGTTVGGGNGSGIVFELTHADGAWSEEILANFLGTLGDGTPAGGVSLDKAGNVYGVTHFGGNYGAGSVFELSPSSGVWNYATLYSFTGGSDGGYPTAGVVLDSKGHLYGTTKLGGNGYSCQGWCGTVFELTPSGSFWNERVLYGFQGGDDGEYPSAPVVLGGDALYGTTLNGGDENCTANDEAPGCGVVYRISP